MGSEAVVALPPPFDQNLRLLQRVEDLSVQQLVSELAVEALDIAVLPRRAWLDEQRPDTQPRHPIAYHLRREFRAVVGPDVLRDSALHEQLAELLEYLLRVQLPFRFDRQALPGLFVNDRQQPEGSALVGTVIQEVVDPNMILALGPQSDARAVVEPQARPFGLFLRHFQPLLPPDPLHSFRVH